MSLRFGCRLRKGRCGAAGAAAGASGAAAAGASSVGAPGVAGAGREEGMLAGALPGQLAGMFTSAAMHPAFKLAAPVGLAAVNIHAACVALYAASYWAFIVGSMLPRHASILRTYSSHSGTPMWVAAAGGAGGASAATSGALPPEQARAKPRVRASVGRSKDFFMMTFRAATQIRRVTPRGLPRRNSERWEREWERECEREWEREWERENLNVDGVA